MTLERRLRTLRDEGRKLLVVYLTAGVGQWRETVEAIADAGADAIEIGIPFSDPVMDGPVIQEACERAIDGGTNPHSVLAELRTLRVDVPLVVMTYYNLVFRFGLDRFAGACRDAGVAAAILPDLPLAESGPWCDAADAHGVETVLLGATTCSDEHLSRIAERSRGFVYGVGVLGVTGERADLAESAVSIAQRLGRITDLPVLIGVGVSTPDQAVQLAAIADGVVVGSAVVRRFLDTDDPAQVGELVRTFRMALDQ